MKEPHGAEQYVICKRLDSSETETEREREREKERETGRSE